MSATDDMPQQTTPDFEIVENADAGRFELWHDGSILSYASYSQHDSAVVVPHVETAPQHRGNGYAARLMEGLLAIIRADGRTITPLCPFAADHVRGNAEHHDLVTS